MSAALILEKGALVAAALADLEEQLPAFMRSLELCSEPVEIAQNVDVADLLDAITARLSAAQFAVFEASLSVGRRAQRDALLITYPSRESEDVQ